ncbi:MAG: PspC domain-containing protein [Patescibacteria group bacterium]
MNKRLVRSQSDKILAGVAGGLAEYFDTDATIIRLLFILFLGFSGSGILIYFLLWLVMPQSANAPTMINRQRLNEFAEEIKEKAGELKKEWQNDSDKKEKAHDRKEANKRRGGLFGWVLIILGLIIAFNNFAPFWMRSHLTQYWPLLLIGGGIIFIVNASQREK